MLRSRSRLGAALQLGFVRKTGTTLDALDYVPRAVLEHVGHQLGMSAPELTTLRALYRRQMTKEEKASLMLRWTDYAPANLAARVEKFRKIDQFVEIDGRTGAIQFLRGVSSRASFMLPSSDTR